jgi:hypothetical protein
MPTQPNVPWWFAVAVLAVSAVITAALAYQDPAVVIPPLVRFFMFLANVGLSVIMLALNIKKLGT